MFAKNNHTRSFTATLLLAAPLLTLTSSSATAQEPGLGSTNCKFDKDVSTQTQYSTNVIKAVLSIGGLLFSTQTCYDVTTVNWKYEYVGPPIQLPSQNGFAPDPGAFEVRILNAEAKCAGDAVSQTSSMALGLFRVAALNGSTIDLPATPITGTLPFFLGANFDPTPFNPSQLASSAWTGYSVIVPANYAMAPTLTFTDDALAELPTHALMDLNATTRMKLAVDLAPQAAGSLLVLLTSASLPDQNSLFQFGGTTVPVVYDWFSDAFLQAFPPVVGVADANGDGGFSFPALPFPVLDGIDVRAAVLALDANGAIPDASTFVTIGLRDFTQCQ